MQNQASEEHKTSEKFWANAEKHHNDKKKCWMVTYTDFLEEKKKKLCLF